VGENKNQGFIKKDKYEENALGSKASVLVIGRILCE
jgi:hypothetical protein